jgi:hypothetical protein
VSGHGVDVVPVVVAVRLSLVVLEVEQDAVSVSG